MAHFWGSLKGNRGEVTKCSTKQAGLSGTLASWNGAVSVELFHQLKTGEDHVIIRLIPWNGEGVHKPLYDGPIGGLKGDKKG